MTDVPMQPGAPCRDLVGLRCIVIAVTERRVYWRCTHTDIRSTGSVTHAEFAERFTLSQPAQDGERR